MLKWLLNRCLSVDWEREPKYLYPRIVVRFMWIEVDNREWNELGHLWMVKPVPPPGWVRGIQALWQKLSHFRK